MPKTRNKWPFFGLFDILKKTRNFIDHRSICNIATFVANFTKVLELASSNHVRTLPYSVPYQNMVFTARAITSLQRFSALDPVNLHWPSPNIRLPAYHCTRKALHRKNAQNKTQFHPLKLRWRNAQNYKCRCLIVCCKKSLIAINTFFAII